MTRHTDPGALSPWVRRFLLEHLIGERSLSGNTQRSYRDTLRLLLPYVARCVSRPVDALRVEDVSADVVRGFLRELEQRGCGPATRNQRLAAIRTLARFIGGHCPEFLQWAGAIRNIPVKKTRSHPVHYLEKTEMDALLAAPERQTALGQRDHALLLFLLNTGARASEVAQARIRDLELGVASGADRSWVVIHGKGAKERHCPLWKRTVEEVRLLVHGRGADRHIFVNRCGNALTRFGVRGIVQRHADVAARAVPSLVRKRVSTHTIRHTAAMHLLREGVDINTIRAWLGHESLSTTNVYAEADLEMKAKALAACEISEEATSPPWREDQDLMAFLQSL
jgi:site-specific recombinase XerD